VRSRRFLLLLLFFLALDFAVPYEPTARGWSEYEDEEESVHPEGRRLARARSGPPRPATGAAVTAARPRPAPVAQRHARRPHAAPVTRLARADTSSSPPASPDAH
jgi:hypothetical protein